MSTKVSTATAAALGAYGVPSFVVSSGISAWSGASLHRLAGTAASNAVRLAVDIPNPMDVRTRVAAKQDRPPRGVPR